MNIDEARAAARDWVHQVGRTTEGYLGAYLSGSTTALSGDSELPVGTDVDIMLVTRQPPSGLKLGKFLHNGALLEVTYLAHEAITPIDRALENHHLAHGLNRGLILDDPTGELRRLHQEVAARFAEPDQVRRRCAGLRGKIDNALATLDDREPWYDQVTNWLFPTGITTHLLLVAALRNPTVRLRYLRTRQLLTELDLADHYPAVLRQLGCEELTGRRAAHHIDRLAITFDATAEVARTPFFFSSDITPAARPISIDASRELVQRGDHREIVFWLVATFARCHKILAADAPALHEELTPAFSDLLADLGIRDSKDLRRRGQATREYLPELWKVTEDVLAAAVPDYGAGNTDNPQ
ncbi:hypothetical protein OG978_05150 [Streptomyces sp. NBC_01591]|uniref:hypothetical protein n=1 Tax=Streptomyces sp. NBC_01591 TaxID=2975888 RepID=UPI002DDC3EC4|nr:hypothetical protein [Streptomyces sp. NBC_01591]WSD66821.1 hypothetical protein OG978_05150 [Streptomyces sp. NBC_01591]